MNITLIVLGVVLALAAILGGGIQVGNISIPAIPSLSRRILVGFLGVVVFCIGLWSYLPPERPKPTDPEPTDRPVPPVTQPGKPRTTLAGTVGLSHHVAAFSERHADYLITASSPSTSEHSADLDAQGRFRIRDIPQAESYKISWGGTGPSEFAIWPLVLRTVRAEDELGGFLFQRLEDVYGNQRRRMLEAVASGNFGEADERLTKVRQLFERIGIRNPPNDHCVVDNMRRWWFAVHRDLARAAYDFRARFGRSQITDKQVKAERSWRRTMINASLEQTSDSQALRDFARSANSWAMYSREVFSKLQQSWPDRSLASRQSPGRSEFLERASYAKLLLEDIALIKEKLDTPPVRALVAKNVTSPRRLERLSVGQQLAVKAFSSLLRQDPDRVSLSQLVNLVSALHRLVVPLGTSQGARWTGFGNEPAEKSTAQNIRTESTHSLQNFPNGTGRQRTSAEP